MNTISFPDARIFRSVFHVHASKVLGGKIKVDLIPNEGLDHENVHSFYFESNSDNGPVAAQVELHLMEMGFVPTWTWGKCQCQSSHGCSLGQFAPEGSHKAVKDSGAYRSN